MRRVMRDALAILCTGLALAACKKAPKPGDPLAGLTATERAAFDEGKLAVAREFEPETGLGPLFNSNACGECHEVPVAGGGGDEVEVHVGALMADSTCDQFAAQGGPVIQQAVTPALKAALNIEREPMPSGAAVAAKRSTPDLFGFGLLDAVSDSVILSYADPDDRNGDGISGRPNRFLDGRLGRFGRKALVPTLREFNAGATIVEQGVTNPVVPTEELIGGQPIPPGVDPAPEPEINQRELDAIDSFVRFLAAPAPLRLDGEAKRGRDLFGSIGCAICHIPSLPTGNNPVAALSRKQVAAFTDLLLHDMGPEPADICFGQAMPSEFRTEPLMGVRLATHFLHDARATTLEQAIEGHGGEGTAARDRFRALPAAQRAALIKYLKAL
jgi:CxxC motif-containing protein (DUF1111 family)